MTSVVNAFDLQGHRGTRGLMPENTLPGYATALTIGVNATTDADGEGGTGGLGDGSTIAPGRGGNGTGGNQEVDRFDVGGRARPGGEHAGHQGGRKAEQSPPLEVS